MSWDVAIVRIRGKFRPIADIEEEDYLRLGDLKDVSAAAFPSAEWDLMKRNSLDDIGDWWSLLIVRDAFFGKARRFNEFHKSLGMPKNLLSARLQKLVSHVVLKVRRASDGKEYTLTEKGRRLYHVEIGGETYALATRTLRRRPYSVEIGSGWAGKQQSSPKPAPKKVGRKPLVLAWKRGFPRGRFSVKDAWKRLKAWCKDAYPEILETLNPGATAAEIRAFEKAIGRELPRDVRESYNIHNGQKHWTLHGLVFGLPLISLDHSLSEWRWWKNANERWKKDKEKGRLPRFEYQGRSFPENAIRVEYVNTGWIPLSEDASGNHFGVDLDPGPEGWLGQVINFGRDQDGKFVLAISWGQFLHDVADELERGNFSIESSRGDAKEFSLHRPYVGFLDAGGAWSLAKLGLRRVTPKQTMHDSVRKACLLAGWTIR